MKRSSLFILLALLFQAYPIQAQDSPAPVGSPVSSAPGPGKPLPEHSKPSKIDLTGLQSRAFRFSEEMRTYATELFTFFAILALIWAGYQAQFRGLEEFVGTLLRIILTSALLTQYKDIVSALIESRDALKTALAPGGYEILTQLGAALGNLGGAIGIMSLSGVAAGVALFGIIILAVVVYTMQFLFEAAMIGFGPLAIATLAFHNTSGIFASWLKTFLAVLLVPVGWLIGAKFFSATAGTDAISTGDFVRDLAATTLYVAGYGAVFVGMPFITLWIVNSTAGAAGAAMPGMMMAASNFIGGFGGRAVAGMGSASENTTVSVTSTKGGDAVTQATTTFQVPGGTQQTNAYEKRIAMAHESHGKIFQPQTQKQS